jgi:hypothetical protein
MAARTSEPGLPVVPTAPIGAAPTALASRDEWREVLSDVLDGLPVGAWDERMLDWVAGWDAATVLTIASWIVRIRAQGASR